MGAAWHEDRPAAKLSPPTPEDADPANGDPVRRCKRCGLPATPMVQCVVCQRPMRGGKLTEGLFVVAGKPLARLVLCEADLWQLLDHDPRMNDPLHVEEGAA